MPHACGIGLPSHMPHERQLQEAKERPALERRAFFAFRTETGCGYSAAGSSAGASAGVSTSRAAAASAASLSAAAAAAASASAALAASRSAFLANSSARLAFSAALASRSAFFLASASTRYLRVAAFLAASRSATTSFADPNLSAKRWTRPPVSTNFCWPV